LTDGGFCSYTFSISTNSSSSDWTSHGVTNSTGPVGLPREAEDARDRTEGTSIFDCNGGVSPSASSLRD
jgi:hypothetical protein